MKNKKIEISEEKAIELYNKSNDSSFKELLEENFGKDFAKPKNIYDIVKDLKSLTQYLKYSPLIYPNPNNSFEKYINACSVLNKVAKIYNEGVILNWKNTNQYKYLPYKYYSCGSISVGASGSWRSVCYASGSLYYKSSLLSQKSYENFKDFWEDYWQIS